jgi:hypothetical protein
VELEIGRWCKTGNKRVGILPSEPLWGGGGEDQGRSIRVGPLVGPKEIRTYIYIDHIIRKAIEIELHPDDMNRNEAFTLRKLRKPVIQTMKK